MERLILTIPMLFGDHHTSAVGRILAALDGVSDPYLSSASKQVALTFDPKVIQPRDIEAALAKHGYRAGDEEPMYPVSPGREPTRHTAAVATAGEAMTFQETAPSWQGRPLWPCPGLEYQPVDEESV